MFASVSVLSLILCLATFSGLITSFVRPTHSLRAVRVEDSTNTYWREWRWINARGVLVYERRSNPGRNDAGTRTPRNTIAEHKPFTIVVPQPTEAPEIDTVMKSWTLGGIQMVPPQM